MLIRDLRLKARVMPWVGLVERGSDDRDGATSCPHRGFVCRLVELLAASVDIVGLSDVLHRVGELRDPLVCFLHDAHKPSHRA